MKDSYYYYEEGIEKIESGNIQEAIIKFLISVTISPHFKTYEQLYCILDDLGYKEESNFMIEKAYQLNPNNDKISLIYAKCMVEQGNISRAKDILNQLLNRNKSYLPARKLLGELDK
jgi:tetratricopeptide (TPR) repeat protein